MYTLHMYCIIYRYICMYTTPISKKTAGFYKFIKTSSSQMRETTNGKITSKKKKKMGI